MNLVLVTQYMTGFKTKLSLTNYQDEYCISRCRTSKRIKKIDEYVTAVQLYTHAEAFKVIIWIEPSHSP